MRDRLRFEKVETTEQFEALKAFAATMDHTLDDTSRTPIVSVFRGDKQIGYFHVVKVPMVSPSFHTDPAICTPRDTIEFIETLRAHMCLNSLGGRTPNGECIAILPDPPASGFTPEILSKLGFVDLKQRLWQALG